MASSHPRPEANVPDDLLLKVTPPRVPRHLVTRARLQAEHEPWASHPLVLVRAPAGYGKTSLLAQWRREHLARGRVVAWVMAQALDYEARFVAALAYAVRVGAGRPGFGATLAETAGRNPLEAVTRWLAELAQMAWDTVLIVDEGERLPEASRALLGYLVRNAPANLRVVVAARADDAGGLQELIDPGLCAELGPAQLCFSLDDTLELVRSRFGAGVSRDAAARLHDVAEGWPLGLQLAWPRPSRRRIPRATSPSWRRMAARCASALSNCCWPSWQRRTWTSSPASASWTICTPNSARA